MSSSVRVAKDNLADDSPMNKNWRNLVGKERVYNKSFEDRDDVIHWDIFNVEDGEILQLSFVSKNSEWMQGVWLMCDQGISINQEMHTSVYLWYSDPPPTWEFTCHSSNSFLSVYNAWDRGYGPNSLSHSSGMLIEDTPNGRLYHCNDIGFDTSFDRVVFKIERLKTIAP